MERSVVALLLSVFCSSAASLALAIALGKQLYDLTGRDLDLGLLGLAEFAPAAAARPRHRLRRRPLRPAPGRGHRGFGDGRRARARPLRHRADGSRVAPIFMLVVAFGIARAFAAPAFRSLPADIIPAEHLPWLIARVHSATWQIALIVGPVARRRSSTPSSPGPPTSTPCAPIAGWRLDASVPTGRPPRSTRRQAAMPSAAAGDAPRRGRCGADGGVRLRRPAGGAAGTTRLRGCDSSAATRSCWAPSPSTCSPCSSAAPSPCCPPSPTDRLGVGAIGLGWLAPPAASAPPSSP